MADNIKKKDLLKMWSGLMVLHSVHVIERIWEMNLEEHTFSYTGFPSPRNQVVVCNNLEVGILDGHRVWELEK